ncbi:alcohol dehydrogenase catalytic domain-containing protein [Paraburkholderia rhynchosiae]|uniref:Alcohol dehydrogenase n=1 Tax=Paraburkholderia rhynchosiae TaxID=487049 RepID=A0A2N7VX91_9BURK|nr:alcohol dehydrogenase catalytic domain-containing protein [Paraburkholderia rhynchosiae]PMS21775.1 alcohol dehydrogenase [Paraburkholderia rhynchosiae]CAB3739173.1 putative zinc-type alcohol dehydrogenase-like protein YdjJ [Paraburkholderia rhynchosiae]
MRAAYFRKVGLPLEVRSLADPSPASGEVVVKIHRCGICGSDLHMTDGHAPHFTLPENSTLGHEFAGEVVAVGKDVEKLKVGDPVTALPFSGCGRCATCLAGKPNFCAQFKGSAAGFAEYAVVAERVTTKLPNTLSMEDGALIEPMAVGLHGVALGRLRPGARVLVIGAGPVGLATIFWARRLGAGRIVATASSRRREALARHMGADAFVVPEAGQDLAALAADALEGSPDVVFECAGQKDLIAQAIHCVKPQGDVVVLGFCTVPDQFVPALAVWKEVRIQFAVTYSMQEFTHVANVFDAGHVEPRMMITGRVSLDALPDAFEALRNRSTQCKVMVNPWLD